MERKSLKGNVILVDADYVDAVAGKLSGHMGGRIGRDLPSADLSEWLVCCALDGSMSDGENTVQAIFVHTPAKKRMEHFLPSDMAAEIDGKAFRDTQLGEFLLYCVADERPDGGVPLMVECIRALVSDKDVKHLVVVAPDGTCAEAMQDIQDSVPEMVTVQLSMERASSVCVQYVSLGYSLMHAMGVSPDEI